MTEVTLNKFMTLYAAAGEVYRLGCNGVPVSFSLMNLTDSVVKISLDKDMPDNTEGTAGLYMTVPAGTAVNEIRTAGLFIYVKAESAGNIVIERFS